MYITFLPAKAMTFNQKQMSSESADLYTLIVVCRQNTICYNYDSHLRIQRRVSISLDSAKKGITCWRLGVSVSIVRTALNAITTRLHYTCLSNCSTRCRRDCLSLHCSECRYLTTPLTFRISRVNATLWTFP